MKFLGWIITVLDAKMQEPTMYGWFHLLFIALTVVATVFLCKRFKNANEKTVRKIILITSLISIVLEIYKQFNYTYSYNGGMVTADYQWYAFPFQFCSTPMYIGLLASLIKNKKIHTALCNYLATFSIFAGLCVMLYPPQVFIETIGINIQTMICHGSMIVIGVYLLYINYAKREHKTILSAAAVFSACVVVAIILNEVANITGLLNSESFNMFYFSPYCEPSLPVYSLVQAVVPYPLSLIIYIVGFTLAAYIMLLIAILIEKIVKRKRVK